MRTQKLTPIDQAPTGVLPSSEEWDFAGELEVEFTSAVPFSLRAISNKARSLVLGAPVLAICTGTIDVGVLSWVDISGAKDVYEGTFHQSQAGRSESGVVFELLSSIRKAFGGSVADLASMLRVRRPTIYAWMDGKSSPQSRNRARLDELGTLGKYWISRGRGPASELLAARPADSAKLRALLASEELQIADAITVIDELLAAPRVDTSVEAMIRRHGLRMPNDDERRDRLDRETGKRISGE